MGAKTARISPMGSFWLISRLGNPLVLRARFTVLVGLVLVTDYRGLAKRAVDTYLNPAHADASLLRTFNRLGFEHPGMDFLRYAGRQRRLVRVWGGFLVAFGLVFLAAGVVLLLRT